MIRSVRRVEAPKLRAWLSNTALVHTRLRLHAVDNARVVNEDVLLVRAYTRAGRIERPVITMLLEGEARITAYDRHVWMAPGDIVGIASKGEVRMRQAGDRFASLAFEWDPGFVGERPGELVRFHAGDRLADLRAIWTDARDEARDPAATVDRLLDALSAIGVPVSRAGQSLREEVPERMQDLTRALDQLLSSLEGQPMMLDLESRLGLSTRQLNRLIADYNERYGFNAGGWIDTRNRRRLMFGATFMTAPGATAKEVAQLVGYQSASAFSRALKTAGLPSPSAIADEVETIGRTTRLNGS
jgi:AraC-like DNA-binding protein